MDYEIAPVAEAHIVGFHAVADFVAREKRYLSRYQAPPLEEIAAAVKNSIADDLAVYSDS
jgi:hypothetical protein